MSGEFVPELDGTIDLLDDQELDEERETQSSLNQKVAPEFLQKPVQLPTPEPTPIPSNSIPQAANSRGAPINATTESGNTRLSTRRLEPGRGGKGRYQYLLSREQTVGVEIDERNVLESRKR